METIPFTDLGDAAVCARVAVQLVKRTYVQIGRRDVSPVICIGVSTAMLDGLAFPMVRLALLSLSVWCESGKQSKDWLAGVVYRDLMGYTFRRCFYAEYKAGRRLTPRVTDRGGQLSLFAAGFDPEEEVSNAFQSGTQHRQGDSRDRLDQRDTIKRRSRLSDLGR